MLHNICILKQIRNHKEGTGTEMGGKHETAPSTDIMSEHNGNSREAKIKVSYPYV